MEDAPLPPDQLRERELAFTSLVVRFVAGAARGTAVCAMTVAEETLVVVFVATT